MRYTRSKESDSSSTASSTGIAAVEEQSHHEASEEHVIGQNVGIDCMSYLYRSQSDTQAIITTTTRDYFEEELAARLNRMATYSNDATVCYALQSFPLAKATWGKQAQGRNDRSEYLCIREKPVTLWILGEAAVTLFKEKGLPRRKAAIMVTPLANDDLKRGLGLLHNLSKPIYRGS